MPLAPPYTSTFTAAICDDDPCGGRGIQIAQRQAPQKHAQEVVGRKDCQYCCSYTV